MAWSLENSLKTTPQSQLPRIWDIGESQLPGIRDTGESWFAGVRDVIKNLNNSAKNLKNKNGSREHLIEPGGCLMKEKKTTLKISCCSPFNKWSSMSTPCLIHEVLTKTLCFQHWSSTTCFLLELFKQTDFINDILTHSFHHWIFNTLCSTSCFHQWSSTPGFLCNWSSNTLLSSLKS